MKQEEFENLYQSYLTPVYRYCYLRLGSKEAAEDVAHVVFEKVWTAKESYRDQGKTPLAYLFTIARNTIIDRLRRNEAIPIDPQTPAFLSIEDEHHDPRDLSHQRETAEIVYRGLGKLDEEPREVLMLRYIAELPYEDISLLLGKTQEAIRQIVSRGLKELRNYV